MATTYQATARLYYAGMEEEVTKTIDGRQEVLQGNKRLTFDPSSGRVSFSKLKITEVSSKHKHQAFCLLFTIEEIGPQGNNKKVIAQLKSNPFHVLSRSNNKRKGSPQTVTEPLMKRSRSLDSLKYYSESLRSSNASSLSSSSSYEREAPSALSSLPTSNALGLMAPTQKEEEMMTSSHRSLLSSSADNIEVGKIPSGERILSASSSSIPNGGHDSNFIDITELLILPQKEAAKQLGISESMLCKRFKERTKRKWPYRYLRKIDKIINMLNLHKSSDLPLSKEDMVKLENLQQEREACLQPVKIRITAWDKLSASVQNNIRGGSVCLARDSFSNDSSESDKESTESDDEEIPYNILETLEMMRGGQKEENEK